MTTRVALTGAGSPSASFVNAVAPGTLTMLVTVLAVGVLALLCCVLYLYRKRDGTAQDTITGPPSGDYFQRYLQNCVARATRRPSYAFGILLLDIRGFAAIRGSLGRSAAEEILADFAERVFWAIRPTDVLSRLADDSFTIILDDVRRITDITRVAMRVQQSMTEAVTVGARGMKVGVSIGVTMNRSGVRVEAKELIAEAETALQRAVSSGRPYVVFDETLDDASRSELMLESELSLAVEGGQFSLVFQPLVTSDTRQLIGFTAFVQWMHPTRGLLRAGDWIALAESSRQMVRIGQWVIGAAVRTLKQLTEAAGRPMLLTFNVAASEIERGELPQHFADALAGDPTLGPMLRIELPSAVFADPSPTFTTVAAKLRELGVGIHIDHAAAGSVALWRSLRLGVRGVRINLSDIDATDAPTLRHLLAASRQIAEEVVVEGIESLEDDRVVRNLNPPVLAQGYQIARPMPLDRALDLARTIEPVTGRVNLA
jgi:diguanylate cyclase (GGDEF)-like protein